MSDPKQEPRDAISAIRVSKEKQAEEDKYGLPIQRRSVARCAKFHNLRIIKEFELIDIGGAMVWNTTQ